MAPWADVLYACDEAWWDAFFPDVSRSFPGELWTVSEAAREKYGLHWVYGHARCGGLSKEPHTIHCGKNSGFQAIGLAYLLGARVITLVGYDMANTGGRTHWHGDYPKGMRLGNPTGLRFQAWRAELGPLATDLRKAGVLVTNASRRTALRCFPRSTLEEALANVPESPDRRRDDRAMQV